MKKEIKYYIAILVVVVIYLISSFYLDVDPLSKRISTVTTLIAAVSFWLQFKRNESLNEASYIMNLNNQFVNNKDMTFIEHTLELYYNEYEFQFKKYGQDSIKSNISDLELKLDLSRESDDTQKLINYLVYLEALAAIIERNILHIDVIDNLFAYRFFLAVNNPVVQETELLPYKDYYQGIFWLSKEWTRIKKRDGCPIPMSENNLADIDTADLVPGECMLNVEFSKASTKDNYNEIAECIYDTDPYIYPTAFGRQKENAIIAIAKLIEKQVGQLFDFENIILAKYNGHVIGACLLYDKPSIWATEKCYSIIKEMLPEENSFEYTSKHYFEKATSNISDDEIYILAFCVNNSYRGRGISSKFLKYIIENYKGKKLCLEALVENDIAVKLYKKNGFKVVKTYDGFNDKDAEWQPECYYMERDDKGKN